MVVAGGSVVVVVGMPPFGRGFWETFGIPSWAWFMPGFTLFALKLKVNPIIISPTAAISSGHIFVFVIAGKFNYVSPFCRI